MAPTHVLIPKYEYDKLKETAAVAIMDRNIAMKMVIRLEVEKELLEKHCQRMIRHILEFYT